MIDLPKNWAKVKISSISELIRGITYKKEDASSNKKIGYLPILRANNINYELNFENLVYVKQQLIKENQFLKKGDIVIAMSSGSKHLVGKSAKATCGFNGSWGAFCAVLRPIDLVNKELLSYHFQSSEYKKLISAIAKGTNINNLKRQHILDHDFLLPPLNEQKRIVAKIEELFSELDKGIESLKKAKEQLKLYRQAVLKQAFDDISLEISLKEITTKIGSGATPRGGRNSYKSSGIPLIRSMNIHFEKIIFESLAYLDEDQAEKLKNVEVKTDDVLLNITGASIGRVNIAPLEFSGGRVNQHVSIIRLNLDIMKPQFLKYFLQSPIIQTWINNDNYGTTRQALTKTMIENIMVPKIEVSEQQKIVELIETQFSIIDQLEADIDTNLKKAETLRQSILKKAFSGQLVPQDPNDEPASVLLEKIKAEKAKLKPSKKRKKGVTA